MRIKPNYAQIVKVDEGQTQMFKAWNILLNSIRYFIVVLISILGNQPFFSQGDTGDGTSLISDQSAASDDLSFSDSSGCHGNPTSGEFEGTNQEQNSAT